jgi:hypothetical protein
MDNLVLTRISYALMFLWGDCLKTHLGKGASRHSIEGSPTVSIDGRWTAKDRREQGHFPLLPHDPEYRRHS